MLNTLLKHIIGIYGIDLRNKFIKIGKEGIDVCQRENSWETES